MKNLKNIFLLFSILCGLPKNLICSKCLFFIGPMPVNIDRRSLLELFKKEHLVLEKSDGIRYLLFDISRKILLIDRKSKSKVIFMNENSLANFPDFLDGELTFNPILEKYYYLIYDTGIINGDWRISSWDLYSRFRAVENFLLSYYNKNKTEQNFLIKKLFFFKNSLKNLLEAISLNSYTKEHLFINIGINCSFHCNKNDGIIFSPLLANYSIRTTCTTYKWKYEFENTMDLLIRRTISKNLSKKEVQTPFNLTLSLNKTKLFKIYEAKRLSFFSKGKNSTFNGFKSIGEFRYIQRKGSWVLKKHRFDKNKPNSFRVLSNTLKIISESLNKLEIVDIILKFQTRKERGKCCIKY